jgi:hypothetical protein
MTRNLPIFLRSAEELLAYLEGDATEEAAVFRLEAQELAAVFRGWFVKRPDPPARDEAVNRLLLLHKRVRDRKK